MIPESGNEPEKTTLDDTGCYLQWEILPIFQCNLLKYLYYAQ